MARGSIFHPDFTPRPYWWEAYRPGDDRPTEVPAEAEVAIVGSGYAGLAAALELSSGGRSAVVLEAADLGFGASTRNGGAVSGGVNLGKGLGGRSGPGSGPGPAIAEVLGEAAEAMTLLELLIERHGIACHYERTGRFTGAWTPGHYAAMASRVDALNRHAASEAAMVPRERQREEIDSDLYFGGMVLGRAGKLHPALYYQGLLRAARGTGALVCSRAGVERIERDGAGFRLRTPRGTVRAEHVIVATNGYTGEVTPGLRRGVIPISSHVMATEELPHDLLASLIPKGRMIADSQRVLCYYRLSPDGRRLIFGGRARFTESDPRTIATALHARMAERLPRLGRARVTHSWTGNVAFTFDAMPHLGRSEGLHFCLGCNGSGVAMMTYLGTRTAREIMSPGNRPSAFRRDGLATHPLYRGNPWFLPAMGGWYRLRDRIDRWLAA